MVKIDHVQRVILENQIVMAEAIWMVLYRAGTKPRMLENISARIEASRQLIDEADEERVTAHEFLTDQGCYIHTHVDAADDEYDIYEGDSHCLLLQHGVLVGSELLREEEGV